MCPSIALVPVLAACGGCGYDDTKNIKLPSPWSALSSQDLETEWLVVAELRSQKLEEITELLSISSDADADEVLRITNWWRETGNVSIPAKLKNYADRLRREFHSLNELSLEIRHAAAAPYGSCSLQSYSLQLNTRYRSSSASTHSMSA